MGVCVVTRLGEINIQVLISYAVSGKGNVAPIRNGDTFTKRRHLSVYRKKEKNEKDEKDGMEFRRRT